jgi:hypothetical protein
MLFNLVKRGARRGRQGYTQEASQNQWRYSKVQPQPWATSQLKYLKQTFLDIDQFNFYF